MADSSTRVAASVVIPTHGRPEALVHCLAAVGALEPPPGGFEVVVVVDGDEGSDAAVAAAEASAAAPRVVVQAQAGPGAARNHGASLARGRWLAFTDDDCRPRPGWLLALAVEVEREPAAVVGGAVHNALTGNRAAAASQLVQEVAWEHFGRRREPASYFPTNNLAITRAAFEGIGGFDAATFATAASEDRDLCDRAVASGLELRPAPEAHVDHHHDLSASGLWRQHHRYGRGARAFQIVRARRGMPPLTVSPGFHAALALAPFRRARGADALRLAGLVGLTQVAYGAGYAAERLRTRGAA